MSDDTTTIEITEDQRDELKARKQHEREGYKDVLARLLSDQGKPVDVDDLKVVSATPEDLTKLRSDLLERLDKIENAAKTAEERTGTIENRLDEMGGR